MEGKLNEINHSLSLPKTNTLPQIGTKSNLFIGAHKTACTDVALATSPILLPLATCTLATLAFFREHTKLITISRAFVYYFLSLDLCFSTGHDFCHFGSICRHFWLSQQLRCYWHQWVEARIAAKHLTRLGMVSYNKGLSIPNVNSTEVEKSQSRQRSFPRSPFFTLFFRAFLFHNT